MTSIVLHGAVCDQVKAGTIARLTIVSTASSGSVRSR